jgi:hypothetical protein
MPTSTVKARLKFLDSDGRRGSVDIPVADTIVTVSADVLTAIDALAALTGGDDGTKFMAAKLDQVELVYVYEYDDDDILPATGDIGNGWRFTFPSGASRTFPGRSTHGSLTSVESRGEFADKTVGVVDEFWGALVQAPPNGILMSDVDDSTPTLTATGIRATRNTRQRPRV